MAKKPVKGKDLKITPTIVDLKGTKYELNFDLNAMAELEEKYDTIQNAIKELKMKKLSAVRQFVYACLKSNSEDLTEHEVGKLIDINNFTTIEKAITKLMNEAIDETEETDTDEGTPKEKN